MSSSTKPSFRYWRLTDYSFACTFKWCTRRTHQTVDFERFDKKLKRPFVICCWLMLGSGLSMAIGYFVFDDVE